MLSLKLSPLMFRHLFLSLALASSLSAQNPLENSLIFTGTTATAGAETYAWLVWQPTDPLIISSKTVAVSDAIFGRWWSATDHP